MVEKMNILAVKTELTEISTILSHRRISAS